MITLETVQGCLLGSALGDAYCAPYEGGFAERLAWRVLGLRKRGVWRWTDDTQMSLDLAESYVAMGELVPDDLARRFAAGYRWSRGFGPGAAKVLKRIRRGVPWREASRSVYPEGSYGNGAAMRAHVVGMIFADRPAELAEAVRAQAEITHGHPLAIEGAMLIARAAAGAARGSSSEALLREAVARADDEEYRTRLLTAQEWHASGRETTAREVSQKLGAGIAAHKSCATAMYLACRFLSRPFEELPKFVAACGGDTDTIGAMAGAIWGAAHGVAELPATWLERLEQRDRIAGTAEGLFRRAYAVGRVSEGVGDDA